MENKYNINGCGFLPCLFLLCCVAYVERGGVCGWWCWAEFQFLLATPHIFLSNNNTFLLISNKLLLISGFFAKPNLFLSRFFCNFTPILSFFFLFKVFFVRRVFFLTFTS